MIDPTVHQLLVAAIDSATKLQLLLMFHENQRLMLTSTQVANRVYRDIWSTYEALSELKHDGVLATDSCADPRYYYHPRAEYVDAIDRLVRSYNEPIERDLVQRTLHEIADEARYRRAQLNRNSPFDLQMI